MQKPRADNLSGSSHGRFSCATSDPSRSQPLSRRNQNTICDLPFLVPVFTTLPASPLLTANAQTGRFIVEQATVSEGANFASSVRTCSNARFRIYNQLGSGGQGYLEAEFDAIDLLPQDLVSADVLREGSQSRDAELRAVD
jgi:hypothetical protein